MVIKHCPKCGNIPNIRFDGFTQHGDTIHTIECPNRCEVLKTKNGFTSFFTFIRLLDQRQMYRAWNEELIDNE